MDSSRLLTPRLPFVLLVPGLLTTLSWWVFLGTDPDDQYTVPQVAGLVLALLAAGAATGWLLRRGEAAAAIASAVVGISVACWTSWSDDATGLFVVGWFMVTVAAVPAAIAVVLPVHLAHNARNARNARVRPGAHT